MNYKSLILKFIHSPLSHKRSIKSFESFISFTISISKIISTITTSCYLNFAISTKIYFAYILPKFHKSKSALKTQAIILLRLLYGIS